MSGVSNCPPSGEGWGGILQLLNWKEGLCVSIFHTHTLSSIIFLFRLGVWKVVGRRRRDGKASLSLKWKFAFTFFYCLWELWIWRLDHQAIGCLSVKPKDGRWSLSHRLFLSGELPSSERTIGEYELAISFWILPNKAESKKKKKHFSHIIYFSIDCTSP